MNGDAELRNAERRWLSGGSALPVVTLLSSRGAKAEAAAVARLALSQANCADAVGLEEALSHLAALPDGWVESLGEFARAPSIERWRELMRFVPPEYYYQRHRETVRRLRVLGVDGDVLFRCASEFGLTPDLIELVEDGEVSADTLIERANRAGEARATYLGLAAEATFLAGDMFGALRLLRSAMARENEWCSVIPHAFFVRERASPEQRALLDQAGIPSI